MVRSIVGLGLLVVGFLLGITQVGAQVEIDPALVPHSFLSGKDWQGLSKGEHRPMPSKLLLGSILPSTMESTGPTLPESIPV